MPIRSGNVLNGTLRGSDLDFFRSTEQTGTGSSQNVAHGLGHTPTLVLVSVSEDASGTGFDVAEGTHDATNAVVTVTSGIKFFVLAL